MASLSLINSVCLIVLTFGIVGADYIKDLCKATYASKGLEQPPETETSVEGYAKDFIYDDRKKHTIAIIYTLKCYAKPKPVQGEITGLKPVISACTVKRKPFLMALRAFLNMVNTVKAGADAVKLKGDYDFFCYSEEQSEVYGPWDGLPASIVPKLKTNVSS